MATQRPLKTIFSKLGAAAFILWMLLALQIQAGAAERLFPEKQHPTLSRTIASLLHRYHYSHYALNDSLSSEIFDRYVKSLDHNKSYFLASDIRQFEKYRYALDDEVKQGNLQPVYDFFNLYLQRADERVDYVLRRLQQPFDFSKDEYYRFDRKDVPWAKTRAELDEIWRKRLKNEALSLKLNGKDQAGIVEVLSKRYKNFRKRLNQYNSEDVFQIFMNSVTESYDPHTNYFSPITSDNFRIQMSLSFEGIGARLTTENDYTKVVEIIPGGPADLSDELHANDKIIGVGQGRHGEIVDVIGWRIDDVVQLIRGKRGTVVRLQVIPAGSELNGTTKIVTLVRDKIKLEEQAAKSEVIEIDHEKRHYKIGVIKIPTFYSDIAGQERGDRDFKSTARDVRRLLGELQAKHVDGIIVDLRNNGGGSLQEAIDVTGLFIKRGPVVQIRNSNGRINLGNDTDPSIVYDGPLAVLVDRLSASASEIFAAAIQDYGRGVVIGSQTFGKG
ncbi:MAG: tail-specific protease, partial [Calditrichaeota bacterium]